MTSARTAPISAIVINGPSSSGKSSAAQALQRILPGLWWHLSTDSLADGVTEAVQRLIEREGSAGLERAQQTLDLAFDCSAFVAERLIGSGQHIIVDTVLQAGWNDAGRWNDVLDRSTSLWVGLSARPETLRSRESARHDRPAGMAERQLSTVHEGIDYDLRLDTDDIDPDGVSRIVAEALTKRANGAER